MTITNFDELAKHLGHKVSCITNTDKDNNVFNVSIWCETCDEVLIDFDKEEEPKIVRSIEKDGMIISVEEMPMEDNLYSIFVKDVEAGCTKLVETNLMADDVEDIVNQLLSPYQNMFGVEYECDEEENTTYEIFDNLPEAIKFSKDVNWIYIFQSDMKNVYQEEDGTWNYEDLSDTLNNTKIIYTNKNFNLNIEDNKKWKTKKDI